MISLWSQFKSLNPILTMQKLAVIAVSIFSQTFSCPGPCGHSHIDFTPLPYYSWHCPCTEF